MIRFTRYFFFQCAVLCVISLFMATGPLYCQVKISGSLKNAKEIKKIYLFELLGAFPILKDSAIVQEGKLNFTSKISYPRGFYLIGTSAEKSLMLILSSESFGFQADYLDLRNSSTFQNSPENQAFKEFGLMNMQQNKSMADLEAMAKALQPKQSTEPVVYQSAMMQVQQKMDSLSRARDLYYRTTVIQKSHLFLSKVLSMFLFSDTTSKANIFPTREFTDEEYTRGDMLVNKLSYYMQRMGAQQTDQWEKEARYILNQTQVKSRIKSAYLVSLIQASLQQGISPAKLWLTSLTEESTLPAIKQFLASLPKGPLVEGDEAYDIVLNDTQGKTRKLSDLKGKVVLLDFWASWCGPCRMENPNVVKAYEKFKAKGFTVFSVSLDQAKDRWVSAIQKDQLIWDNHVSDLKGWQSSAAALYSIKGIPATYLLDKQGKVVARNLRGAQLENKLIELLGKD